MRRRDLLASATRASAALPLAALCAAPGVRARADERFGILDRRAPELEVDYWLDGEGNRSSYSLGENRGKWIFLECFQNWCPGCHAHGFPTLKSVADAFADEPRVSVAAVQTVFEGFETNTREAVRALQVRYELAIPMGHDAGSADGERLPSTMVNYRTGGTPWVIVIEPGGTVAYNDYRIDGARFVELLKETLG